MHSHNYFIVNFNFLQYPNNRTTFLEKSVQAIPVKKRFNQIQRRISEGFEKVTAEFFTISLPPQHPRVVHMIKY